MFGRYILLGYLALALRTTHVRLPAFQINGLLLQDPDRFRPQLAALLTEAAGVPVVLEGPIRWSWQRTLALDVSQVSLRAPAFNVRIERLAVHANMAGLLRLDRLEIENLRVHRDGQPLFSIERIAFDGAAREPAVPVAITMNDRFSANGRMYVDGARLQLHDAVLRTPAGEVKGTLDVDLGARPPRLNAKLHAERLAIAPQKRNESSGRLIPRIPLDLSVLQALDAQIELVVGALTIGELQVRDVVLPATLRQGHLHFVTTARLGGGSVAIEADVRADKQHWSSNVQLAEANAGQLLVLLGLDQARDGGVVNFKAALDADGGHTDELLNSLRGDVSLRLSEVSIDAGATKIAGADVFVGLSHLIRGTESEPIDLHCAVADFTIRDGLMRAQDTLGAQTAVSNLLGGGEISLPQERMDLVVRPWPREGLGLSATALSGAVAISGPLLDPQLSLTDEAVWRTSATAGAAIFTGGLSLLAQGLLERARGDTPCEEAMAQLKVDRGKKVVAESVSASSKSAAKSVSASADSVSETASGRVQKLGQSLTNLFGGGGTSPSMYEPPELQ